MDKSTKNRVKMQSEEAERKLDSRKAIVLEPGNPSMKSQTCAAVAATPWKNYNKMKVDALEKRKVETLQVGGSHISGLMSISTTAKGKRSSRLPSSRGALNISKILGDVVPSQMTEKQDTDAGSEKEVPPRTSNTTRSKPGSEGNNGSKPIVLESMLISLLKDKPNGMTFKALEKVVSDTRPSSIKDLEPTIKRIAIYIPGRYILKPGVDSESFKKPQTESGSLPEENHNQTPAHEDFHNQTSAPQGGFKEKDKHKRGSELKNIDEKFEGTKRLKAGNLTCEPYSPGTDMKMFENSRNLSPFEFTKDTGNGPNTQVGNRVERQGNSSLGFQKGYSRALSGKSSSDLRQTGQRSFNQMFENSRNLSPFEFTKDTGKGPNTQVGNRVERQGNSSLGFQKGYSRAFPGKSSSDLRQTGQRSFNRRPLGNPSYPLEKSEKLGESTRHNRKHSGKDFRAHEVSFVPENKSHKDAQNENIYATEKKVHRDGSNGTKQSLLSVDSNYQKQGEVVGKLKEGRQGTQSHLGKWPKDNNRAGLNKSSAVNGRGVLLQRELSDLELGELRESTPEETSVAKQFERKGSFKHMGIKANTSEDMNSNITEVKPLLKTTLDSGRPTSVLSSGFPSNLENTNKKNVDYHFEDSTKSLSRVMQTHSQHLKADNVDVGSQNKLTEMSIKFRNSESGVSHDIDLDGRGEINRRVPANRSQQDTKHGMVPYPVKESKRQTSNSCEEVPDGRKDSVFADRNNGDQKKKEFSLDENSFSYSKFEKEEPELKGPITTFSQYTEYVQEYQDKYKSYFSLYKILEDYKDEFQKLGDDLEYAKSKGDMDRYDNIGAQIKESYRECGSRYNRVKKIFNVFHEELVNIKQRIKDFVQSNKD